MALKDFTKKNIKGKSLFTDYSELTEEEKSKLFAIEQKVTAKLLRGKDNNQHSVLDCFKSNNFTGIFDSYEIVRMIVRAELEKIVLKKNKKVMVILTKENLYKQHLTANFLQVYLKQWRKIS
jgi:hypothetical protein